MKLVIQIPCLNEERTLPAVLAHLPGALPGVDAIQVLVIDDGSADQTARKAIEGGADKVIRHTRNRGLARTFRTGIDAALKMGADVIVNIDGDGQYSGSDIHELIRPILERRADIVIGSRDMRHFSRTKRFLQSLGSFVVRRVSGTSVGDAASGFRAFSKEAALRLNIFSEFTYTLESIIQAGRMGMAIEQVPVTTNPPTRSSRLSSGNFSYIIKSLGTIIRLFVTYQPLKAFAVGGVVSLVTGTLIGLRFLYLLFTVSGEGHVQSLILAAILIILGFQLIVVSLLADLISANRKISEAALLKIRRLEVESELSQVEERVDI
ncbi:MAG: glycosyltransferase family 2 protein [Planctomycetota bacterium]|nr:glycosyltransferase family 2 protein [Planctomycetota bacterium]